jgi:hypothetical protein
MRAPWILGYSAVLALAATPAFAQPVVAAKSGTISVADGKVFLDDKLLEIQPGQFPDMKEKSVLRTEEGRAEVLLPPGMFLRVGENASFRMVSNRLVDTRVELLKGSGVVEIDATSKDAQVTMISKDGTVTFTKGIYRFDSEPARLKVFEGNADVAIAGRSVTVSTGKMIGLTGETASVEKFDVTDTDSLDHWSRRRGEELAMANVSAAKRAQSNSWSSAVNPCMGGYGPAGYMGYGGIGYGGLGYGAWAYNPWYGMYTYMPCSGMFMSPYGYNLWSPYAVGGIFYGGGSLFGRGVYGSGLLGGTTAGALNGTITRAGLGFSNTGTISRGYAGVIASGAAAGSSSAGTASAASAGRATAGGFSGGGSHMGGGLGGGGHAGGGGGHR